MEIKMFNNVKNFVQKVDVKETVTDLAATAVYIAVLPVMVPIYMASGAIALTSNVIDKVAKKIQKK
jgi:hypothetical protein